MNNSVSLKGTKEGYQLIIQSSASFESILEELKELTMQLKKDSAAGHEITFFVKTGKRELTNEEKAQLTEIIEDDHFKVHSFEAEVISVEKALKWHIESAPTLEAKTVRSGQIVEAEGDLLLIGGVHPGGTVRATGSIFIIGELRGIAHAGYGGKESAIVVGNFRYNAQVRIGDNVHVIEQDEDSEELKNDVEFVYVNDLHIIEVSPLQKLKTVRPEIGKYAGGLM
ncbi:septum site-determining protein MinC [Alkalibacterium iburiense]|uniref:Probable septum site-determining protein MinC n=1 Tax=Alkalibacterium iburiense TaxID=290589 RepID=A0ABN0XSP0_9LACT